jgi:hypothetical protein
MEDDLEKELRLVRQVENLKLHDVLRIVEKVVSITNALYAEDMPYGEEYALLREAIRASNRRTGCTSLCWDGHFPVRDISGVGPC